MSMFFLLGTVAEIALAMLALAAGTILAIGVVVTALVWLSGSRPVRAHRG